MPPSNRSGGQLRFSIGRRPLALAAIAVLAVKLAWFAVDSMPLFYMGDSRAYVYSGIGYTVLTDRSNSYGWLVWLFAVVPGSLTPLVVAQTVAGAATAWLLAFVLLRFFKVHAGIALSAAVVLAAEPLQILYERMVLTESFAILLLAVYVTLSLSYLARPRPGMLVAIAGTGVLLLSLRLVYVPVTLFNAVLVPSLVWASPSHERRAPNGAKRFLAHLVLSVLATFVLHWSYKMVIGRAANLPPAYQYANGFFLASAWAPLIEPDDATDPRARRVVEELLAGGRYPLRSVSARNHQLWSSGGLKSELIKAFGGDIYSANRAAHQMSKRTLRRVPLSVTRIAALNYATVWLEPGRMRQRLLTEQGSRRGPDSLFLTNLQGRFNFDATRSSATMTASRRYHLMGVPWYVVLALSPLIGILAVLWSRREVRSGTLLLFVTGTVLLLVPCFVVPNAGLVRSLHPLAFGTLAALAVIANRLIRGEKPMEMAGRS